MLLGTHSHLHGCRNLCILQHCWLEGCNRWQRPRLLLILVKSSAPRSHDMLLGTHSHLHGCRNLCILQHCWLEGCNRWQRPRLLLILVKSSAPRSHDMLLGTHSHLHGCRNLCILQHCWLEGCNRWQRPRLLLILVILVKSSAPRSHDMLLGTHSHLHGCRNLCILQHCWLEGCNRWQRPRLLLVLVKSLAPRKPHAVGYAFSPARLPQSVHPTTLLA